MISENNGYIYINDSDILGLNRLKNSRYGSNSNIYLYKDILLKIMNYPLSNNELVVLDILKSLTIKNISIPIKYIIKNQQIIGYSMNYLKGDILFKLNEYVRYDNFLECLVPIEKSIHTLSLEGILMCDINCFNVLYSEYNNVINIVDVDYYKFNNQLNKDIIYLDNLFYFEKTLFSSIASKNKYLTSDIYKELENKMRTCINNNVSILDTFKCMKNTLENYSNREINTIHDFRKILKK